MKNPSKMPNIGPIAMNLVVCDRLSHTNVPAENERNRPSGFWDSPTPPPKFAPPPFSVNSEAAMTSAALMQRALHWCNMRDAKERFLGHTQGLLTWWHQQNTGSCILLRWKAYRFMYVNKQTIYMYLLKSRFATYDLGKDDWRCHQSDQNTVQLS